MAKILIIGSGGREHALAWRLAQERHRVFAAPGSAGMREVADSIDVAVSDGPGLVRAAAALQVDLVVVGPEQPLVDGVGDVLRAAGFATVGPSARGAVLEGSKAEAKAFMVRHGIPTARGVTLRSGAELDAALRQFEVPPVVKADGLAAGKGVTVATTHDEARAAALACLQGDRFGAAGATVVLEERMTGQEVSFFVLTDGVHAATFEPAQDHKRIGEGDTGPNTGGMGAYVPAPVFTETVRQRTMDRIVMPTLAGLAAEERPYRGVLFVGLMIDEQEQPRVVEYNCRFGDPEVQPLMLGLQTELYPRLWAAATGSLRDERLPGAPAATVVMASHGYPDGARAGDRIEGLRDAAEVEGVHVFHAGTRLAADGGWETAGGRVLGICARADAFDVALSRAYAAVDRIRFDGMQFRRDIGARAML